MRLRIAFMNPFRIHPHLIPLPEGEDENSEEALNLAVEELEKDRGLMSPACQS